MSLTSQRRSSTAQGRPLLTRSEFQHACHQTAWATMIWAMEEKQVKYPLGTLSRIEAVTFGEPGRRTFRLDIHSGSAFCSVWLEKEQLSQLGVYLRDFVAGLSAEEKGSESSPQEPGWGGGGRHARFQGRSDVSKPRRESNSFYMQAHERETEEEQEGVASPGGPVGELLDDSASGNRTR